MMRFLRMIYASIVMQHKNYFFNKSIYVSLAVWPIMTFINTYYSYKPFSSSILMQKIGLSDDKEIYVFLLVGFVGMMCFHVLIQSAWQSAYGTRISGALELLYMSPASRIAVLIGNSIASLLGSIWMIVIFAFGMLVMFREVLLINIVSISAGVLLLLFVAVCWGVFLNSLFLYSRDSGFLFTIFQDPVEMFTGAKIPFPLMPVWAKTIGHVIPLTYIITVLRKIILHGTSLASLCPEIAIGLGISFILLVVAYIIAILSERNSKVKGTATLF